ncbi:Mimitin, mitochondrial [Irineochytrium annulatum]|nr:Mimitin, mitochondrial [Irineochytrium annulatum]
MGTDPHGNMYFEGPPRREGQHMPRRKIEYFDGRTEVWSFDGMELPVQWQAWLRFTRDHPPTLKEIEEAEEYRQRVFARAQELERREKPLLDPGIKYHAASPFKPVARTPESIGQGETFQPGEWSANAKPMERGG